MTAEPTFEYRLDRYGWLLLLLTPLAVLLLDDNLFFGGPYRDSWIYYGYFQDGIDYLRRFPDHYYGSRLSVIVPGYLAVHVLPPVAANLALRIALLWTTLGSFWVVARARVGARAALLAGLALIGYPYFLTMEGWNYVDGFGVAYFAVAMACAVRQRERGGTAPLLFSGMALSAMVTANLLYAILLPIYWLELASDGAGRGIRRAGTVAVGAVVGVLGFATLAWLCTGSPWYLRASLAFGDRLLRGIQPNIWRRPLSDWLRYAYHLVVPVGLLVATLIGAARRRASPEQPARTAFIAFAALVVLAEWSGRNIAQMTYGVSLTMLTAFCALGAQWRVVVEPLSTSAFARLAALASVAAVAPYALVGFGVRLPDVPVLVPLAIVGGVAAAALLRPGWKAALVTVASLTLASVLLRSEFQVYTDLPGRARELYVQMDAAFRAIDDADPQREARIWYDRGEPHGLVFDSVAAAFLLCPRMISAAFPEIEGGRMCDGTPIAAGGLYVVLSRRDDAFELARGSLARLGFDARLERDLSLPGPVERAHLVFLRVVGPPQH